jgi:hypothetical protein
MSKHSKAEHYGIMLNNVHDEIRDDCMWCFTDDDGADDDVTHYIQFDDGSAIDSDGNSYSKELWEYSLSEGGLFPCDCIAEEHASGNTQPDRSYPCECGNPECDLNVIAAGTAAIN